MSAKQENSAVAIGLEKVSFHPNHKERQCQRMFKLPYNCSHFTCQQGNVQNPSSQASTVHELRTSRCIRQIQKRQGTRDYIADICWIIEKARGFQKNICFIYNAKAFDCVDHNKLQKIFKEMGMPNHLTCLLRHLYSGQEATERDMKQRTGSKQGKEYVKAVYCHPAYLTYMQSTSCECWAG